MGALTRAKDWASTSLGDPSVWPQSLKTTISILLHSKFPMFLFWGPELIQFYNDAYRPSLGNAGKHPAALGQPGHECWTEIWPTIKPIIDQVLSGGASTYGEDQLIPIYRNGKLEDVYWTFGHSPVFDDDGNIGGVLVVCTENTNKIEDLKRIRHSEALQKFTIDAAELATWDLDPDTNTFFGSERVQQLFGIENYKAIDLNVAMEAIVPEFRQTFTEAMQTALKPGNDGKFEVEYEVINLLTGVKRNVLAKGKAMFNHEGKATKFSGIIQDITERKKAEDALRISEQKFRNTVQQAPIAICVLKGNDFIVETANKAYLTLVDKSETELLGLPLLDALPEVRDVIEPMLTITMDTGEAYSAQALKVFLQRYGTISPFYFDILYHPLKDDGAITTGIMVVVSEVTTQVQARLKLEESEKQFRSLVLQSPIAMCIFKGPEFTIEIANEALLKPIWRKKLSDVQGKNLLDVFPELKDQKFPRLLAEVFINGLTYQENEAPAKIVSDDGERNFYFDFVYAPIFDDNHIIDRIMATVTDVTEKVEARQLVREAAERLELATEGTQLATWDLNLLTNSLIHSPRMAIIFGLDPSQQLSLERAKEMIHPDDLDNKVIPAYYHSLAKGDFYFEARIIHADTTVHWIRTSGKPIFDALRQPVRMLGTMMDITEQKESELLINEQKTQLEIVLDASDLGTWQLDFVTGKLDYSPRLLEIVGPEGTDVLYKADFLSKLDAADRLTRDLAVEKALITGDLHYVVQYRNDDQLQWIEANGKVLYDVDKKPFKMIGTLRDLTEEKLYQQKVEESEQRFRTVADTAPVLIWTSDISMLCNFFNKAWLEFRGKTIGEEYGNGWASGVHPNDLERCIAIYESNFSARTEFYMEYRLQRFDGEYRWISDNGVPRFANNGDFEGYIGACMDIHDRIIFEEKLKESENRLRIAAFSGELGTWDFKPETGSIFCDNAMKELLRVTDTDPLSLALLSSKINPDDRSMVKKMLQNAMNPDVDKNLDVEFRVINEPGYSLRWIHAKGKVFFNSERQPFRFSGTALDVTEKKVALEDLRYNEQKYRFLANAMPQLVWTGGADGVLDYFNEAVYDYTGLSQEKIAELGWLEIVHPDERQDNIEKWMLSIKTGEPFILEHRFRRADGIYRWQLSRATAQKDAQGNIKMWVGTSTDIDDLKRHEQQKNDFIKMANHELKTPVTTIKGYVQLLLKAHVTGPDKLLSNSLITIDKQVGKLTNLVSDLLDVTKIERGSLPLKKELISIKGLVEETINDMGAAAQSHEIVFNAGAEILIYADKDRISQVLINLFTNATKYSPGADEIIVQLTRMEQEVVISVRDFGIGIAARDQEKIFERFYRVSGKDEKTFPGFGIGLFIVNEIIQLHKGKIWVESEKDKGSTFYFSLPFANC